MGSLLGWERRKRTDHGIHEPPESADIPDEKRMEL